MKKEKIYKKIEEFFDLYGREIFLPQRYKSIEVDFNKIIEFDHKLGEELLNNPEDVLELFKDQLKKKLERRKVSIRISNLLKSCHLKIINLRKKHLNKLYCFEGIVSRISDTILNLDSITFACPSCTNEFVVSQKMDNIIAPTKCSCGRKGKMTIKKKKFTDIRKIMLEDLQIEREGSFQPILKMVILKEPLTSPLFSKCIQPGIHVEIVGILKAEESKDKTEINMFIEANNIHLKEKSFYTLELTKKEIEQVKRLSKDPKLLDKLAQSISPGTEGLDIIKKALVIQHFRSDNVYDENKKLDDRGTINICLVGPPGTAKTYLSKKSISLNPISLFTSGKGISGVGLIAAVTFDKTLNCWTLDPGAVPICNKGIICIDEADKIDQEDLSYLNNAMNDLSVPVNKANVRANLATDVSFLCCANPQYRIFDNSTEKYRQLGLPPDFLDRFDLIFAIEYTGGEEERQKVIKKIVERHSQILKPIIDKELFQKYIAYAWQHIHPKIDSKIYNYILNKIDPLIDPATKKKSEISYRIIGTILRLSKAIARLYYSNVIRHKDIDMAIEFLLYSYRSLEMMDESEKLTIESFQKATPKKQIKAHELILEYLSKQENQIAAREDLRKLTADLEEREFESILEMLKKSGDIFEPKLNFYKKI